MKSIIALMLCAMLALAAPAAPAESAPDTNPEYIEDSEFADELDEAEPQPELSPDAPGENPLNIPAPRLEPTDGDAIALEINGETVRLLYDNSPQYSTIAGGLVQASYYSYGADGITLYELYIIFPDSAVPGMVITPEYASITGEESSVVLIQSDNDRELYYLSSLMDGSVYPAGSTFTIAIDSVEVLDGATTYSGSLSATLIAPDMITGEAEATLEIPQTPFRFTLGNGVNVPHAEPVPTAMPGDLRKV